MELKPASLSSAPGPYPFMYVSLGDRTPPPFCYNCDVDLTRQAFGVFALFVLAVAGVWPKRVGFKFEIAALAVALLYCLGPLGESGVIDFRSYRHHPYLQPGLFMTLVSGGIVLGRCWVIAVIRLIRRGRTPWIESAALLLVLGATAFSIYDRTDRATNIVDRIRRSGAATPDDLNELMLAARHDYPNYGHAEGELSGDYRFAPGLCRSPGGPVGRFSDSDDLATHGGKLYTLYARDRAAYISLYTAKKYADLKELGDLRQPQPVGQVIVKESFTPREMPSDAPRSQGIGPAVRDGRSYLPGGRRDLFVMINLGPDVKGTDDGWVYGTLTPDYCRVSSAGLVGNCMKCHDSAPNGRLFGLPLTPEDASEKRSSNTSNKKPTTTP